MLQNLPFLFFRIPLLPGQLRIPGDYTITPLFLGHIEGVISITDQQHLFIHCLIQHSNADTYGHRPFIGKQIMPLQLNLIAKPLGEHHRLFLIGMGHDYGKLLAAISTDNIFRPRVDNQGFGNKFYNFIAIGMAILIIDHFEMVDIDHHESQAGLLF